MKRKIKGSNSFIWINTKNGGTEWVRTNGLVIMKYNC